MENDHYSVTVYIHPHKKLNQYDGSVSIGLHREVHIEWLWSAKHELTCLYEKVPTIRQRVSLVLHRKWSNLTLMWANGHQIPSYGELPVDSTHFSESAVSVSQLKHFLRHELISNDGSSSINSHGQTDTKRCIATLFNILYALPLADDILNPG